MVAVFDGRHAAECVVGTVLVVVDQELSCGFAHVVEPGEQMLVEHLLAVGPVEAFDVGVLVRSAGLDVLDGHALLLRPLGEGFAQELGAVVGPQHLRQGTLAPDLFEDAHQACRGDRRVDLDVDRLAIEVVGDVERPEVSAAGERVEHEVGRPHRVRLCGHIERNPITFGQPPGGLATEIELHGAVHAVDALFVPLRMSPLQQLAARPEPTAGLVLDQTRQRRNQLGITDGQVQRRRIPC